MRVPIICPHILICSFASHRDQIAAVEVSRTFRGAGPEPALPPGYAREQQLLDWEARFNTAREERINTQVIATNATAAVEACRVNLALANADLLAAERRRATQRENRHPRI